MSEPRPELPHPLRRVLVDEPDPRRHARIWRGVVDGRRPRRSWVLPIGVAVAASIVGFWLRAPRLEVEPASPVIAEAPRAITPSPEPAPIAPSTPTPPAPRMIGGAKTQIASDAKLIVIHDEPERTALRLETGRVEVDLADAEAHPWTLDCDLAKLELFGAQATIDRAPKRLSIDLSRGAIELRGPAVSGGFRRIEAPSSVVLEGDAELPKVALRPAAKLVEPEAPVVVPAPAPAPAPMPSAEVLLSEAERAQAARDWARAVERLSTLVDRYPSDPRSALASFTRGRIELDQLDRPHDAVRSFQRAFTLGLPDALEEDGLGRLYTAHQRAGDLDGARQIEARYRARFPSGKRLDVQAPGAPRR